MTNQWFQVATAPWLRVFLALSLLASVACTPVLNWRQVRLGGAAQALFPCKPDLVERSVALEAGLTAAHMWSCDAAGSTWSITRFELATPASVSPTLRELRHKLLIHLKGSEDQGEPAFVKGMTPNEQARRSRIQGLRPDGQVLSAEAVWAAQGRLAYQIVVLSLPGATASQPDAFAEFLGGLNLGD